MPAGHLWSCGVWRRERLCGMRQKQYRTDEELIRAVNQLEEGTVPDKMLLIPRVR